MDIKCPKCSKTFNDKSEFMKHGKQEHAMSQPELNALIDWLGSLEPANK